MDQAGQWQIVPAMDDHGDRLRMIVFLDLIPHVRGVLFEKGQIIEGMAMEGVLPWSMLVLMVQRARWSGSRSQCFSMMVMGDPLMPQNDRKTDQQDLRYGFFIDHPAIPFVRKSRKNVGTARFNGPPSRPDP